VTLQAQEVNVRIWVSHKVSHLEGRPIAKWVIRPVIKTSSQPSLHAARWPVHTIRVHDGVISGHPWTWHLLRPATYGWPTRPVNMGVIFWLFTGRELGQCVPSFRSATHVWGNRECSVTDVNVKSVW